MSRVRRYIVAGLLVWVPLGVTLVVVKLLVDLLDRTLLLLPVQYRPETLLGFHIPGLGIILGLVIVIATGMIAANLIGRRVVRAWETLLARIPLVRSIYSSVKQVVETVISNEGRSFRRVVLVEFPRPGIWTLGFVTGDGLEVIQRRLGSRVFHVFVPTTPNPTSGFFLMVPPDQVRELDLSVEDGLKMIISGGVFVPPAIRNGNSGAPAAVASPITTDAASS